MPSCSHLVDSRYRAVLKLLTRRVHENDSLLPSCQGRRTPAERTTGATVTTTETRSLRASFRALVQLLEWLAAGRWSMDIRYSSALDES